MERTYEIVVTIGCRVAAADEREADEAARALAELVGGWVDGSIGNSPFDYFVSPAVATATRREIDWRYGTVTADEIWRLRATL